MKHGISIVIPTWNGIDLLRENLPSVITAADYYRERTNGNTEFIVVDDASQDDTCEILPAEFPSVRWIPKARNDGFGITCNIGFSAASLPLVALLNNDVRVEPEYLYWMARHFESSDSVFAVTAKVYEWDSPVFATGGKVGRFRRGLWSVYFNFDFHGSDADVPEELLSIYAVGGFALYDRLKLKELGGFNELLSPFHWEDIDLSYRGWKRGWTVHYEPRSLAHHRVSATIDKHYVKKKVETVSLRNRLLFHWINLHSPGFLVAHCVWLPLITLSRALVLDWHFFVALYEAFSRLPAAFQLRRTERESAQRTDVEVARLLRSFYRTAPVTLYDGPEAILRDHPESPRGRGEGPDQ